MTTPTPAPPTQRAVKHLKAASATSNGRLPEKISKKVLHALLTDGYAYRPDGDGYRLSVKDALAKTVGPVLITVEGRRAALSAPQLYALTRHVGPNGRLAPNVTWQTASSLVDLGLAEYRDANGNPKPTDGDTGVSGAVHYPFRTALGQQVAELPALPAH
ncbi:hypothetical protein ACFYNO_39310 [Kitasatospora sp. NPDC006697]|uniref:hypothetical protein n=1 Tax=unclassified Kitasatospora TaxID=2633591 RepID=UPI0036825E3B